MLDGHDVPAGTLFAGRYAIERLLRRGGMGAVYVVRHVRTHAELALKVMHPEVVGDAAMRERFAREAQVSSLIKSSNVVTVIDADVDAATGIPFLVMELLHGADLGEHTRSGPLAPKDVVTYLGQAARALDRAHALGIVHRDLKPENLFLASSDDDPPRIKIPDFGIAKILQVATAHGRSQEIGTPLYMAPEQMRAQGTIGAWTDVWALGLTAYTLLVGRPYWEGTTVHEIYSEILRADREAASVRATKVGIALPISFDAWFARCVANEPTSRFASAGEAITRLSEALGESLAAPAPKPAPIATVPLEVATAPMARTEASTSAPSMTDARPAHAPPRPNRPEWLMPMLLGAAALASLALIVTIASMSSRPETATPSTPTPSSEPSTVESTPPSASVNVSPKGLLRKRIEASNPFVDVGITSLQRHEVTREEISLYLATLSVAERARGRPLDEWVDKIDVASARRPVTWITHPRAERFCSAIGARLPSVSELRAALSGKKYPWGDAFPPPGKVAFDQPTTQTLLDVESSPIDRTPSGIADLFGSVREWTADVDSGFATVWGVALGTPRNDAVATFVAPSMKEADEGDDPKLHATEIAGAQLGFRCAR